MTVALLIILASAFQHSNFLSADVQAAQNQKPGTTIVIHPTPQKTIPEPVGMFRLYPSTPGRLVLKFESKDPTQGLRPTDHWVVELIPAPPLQLNPALVTQASWPKTNQVFIAYSKADARKGGQILIAESYRLCSSRTKKCNKVKWKKEFSFKP